MTQEKRYEKDKICSDHDVIGDDGDIYAVFAVTGNGG